jgi:prolyl oligopeptidase
MTVRRPLWLFLLSAVLVGLGSTAAADAPLTYPPAAKHPVTETVHGVTIVDDYRWMEEDAAPEVKAWVRQENALTRKILDAVPQRPEIARRSVTSCARESSPATTSSTGAASCSRWKMLRRRIRQCSSCCRAHSM